jgi:hypothetical protein
MAQTERNQDSISYNGNTTTITNLRAAMKSGSVVRASDMNDLSSMIRSWDNHTHTYTDSYQLATFGNNGDRTNYTESKTTDKHNEDTALANEPLGGLTTSSSIAAYTVNEMVRVVNKLRAHNHNINDRTAI